MRLNSAGSRLLHRWTARNLSLSPVMTVRDSIWAGPIYVSTNSGATWSLTPAPVIAWQTVASSVDGTHLVAAAVDDGTGSYLGGPIYTSPDSGQTWQLEGAPQATWMSVASSADGGKLVGVTQTGNIYTWQSDAAAAPALSIARTDSDLVISWPPGKNSFVGYNKTPTSLSQPGKR